jgi:hypothetical protein
VPPHAPHISHLLRSPAKSSLFVLAIRTLTSKQPSLSRPHFHPWRFLHHTVGAHCVPGCVRPLRHSTHRPHPCWRPIATAPPAWCPILSVRCPLMSGADTPLSALTCRESVAFPDFRPRGRMTPFSQRTLRTSPPSYLTVRQAQAHLIQERPAATAPISPPSRRREPPAPKEATYRSGAGDKRSGEQEVRSPALAAALSAVRLPPSRASPQPGLAAAFRPRSASTLRPSSVPWDFQSQDPHSGCSRPCGLCRDRIRRGLQAADRFPTLASYGRIYPPPPLIDIVKGWLPPALSCSCKDHGPPRQLALTVSVSVLCAPSELSFGGQEVLLGAPFRM